MGSRLEGKRVVITGAASGIGRAAVELFVSEGARVFGFDIAPSVSDLAGLGPDGRIRTRIGDAADEADVGAVIAEAVAEWGGVDVCFLNAGTVGTRANIWNLKLEDWERAQRINLTSVFLGVKAVSRTMFSQKAGSIICTASVAGLRAGNAPAQYGASKAGVINLVQTAANEFTGSGVRINAICPGVIETGLNKTMFEQARAEGVPFPSTQFNPLKRQGQPIEIAQAALFLASDESAFVNGQAIAVDGGWSAGLVGSFAVNANV